MNLVLTNYTVPEQIFALSAREGIELILDLTEQKKEQRAWEFYLTVQQTVVLLNPHKSEKNQSDFKSYSEFRKELEKPQEQRLTEVEKDRIRAKAKAFNERLVKQNETI